jgi:hypothetical protein
MGGGCGFAFIGAWGRRSAGPRSAAAARAGLL